MIVKDVGEWKTENSEQMILNCPHGVGTENNKSKMLSVVIDWMDSEDYSI